VRLLIAVETIHGQCYYQDQVVVSALSCTKPGATNILVGDSKIEKPVAKGTTEGKTP
jgi:hypothetical protein